MILCLPYRIEALSQRKELFNLNSVNNLAGWSNLNFTIAVNL